MRHAKRLLLILLAFALLATACGSDEAADSTTETSDEQSSAGDDAPAGTDAEDPESEDPESEDPESEPVTLRVLVHQNPPMVEFMETFNDEFEAANPNISIDMAVVNADDLGVANQTRLSANDIDVTTITWQGFSNPVQPYMTGAEPPAWQTLIEAGLLMDLTDEAFVQNYDEAAITEGGSFEDRVYSINLGRVSYSGMFVNLDLLTELGVEVPTTWDELVAACETIKAGNNECMTAGGADGWPIFIGASGLLGSFYPDQAGLVEGLWSGDIKLNDERTTELWRRYQTYATDMLEDGVTGLGHDAAIVRYAAGDVAFAPTGVWQAPALEDAEPAFEWTYIPFPGSDNAEDNQYLFGKYDQGWAIAADTPNRDASIAYLAAFSEPDTYNEFANAVGFLPTQPTATLNSTLGEAVAPLLANYRVGYEQWWTPPSGAGQWSNVLMGASWFAPFNEWEDAVALADQAQADLEAGLNS